LAFKTTLNGSPFLIILEPSEFLSQVSPHNDNYE